MEEIINNKLNEHYFEAENILREFLLSGFYGEIDCKKILKEIPSYDILLLYLQNYTYRCLGMKNLLKELEELEKYNAKCKSNELKRDRLEELYEELEGLEEDKVKVFEKHEERNRLPSKGFTYANNIFYIYHTAARNYLKEIESIFDKYTCEGQKDGLKLYFKNKRLILENAHNISQKHISSYKFPENAFTVLAINNISFLTETIIDKLKYYVELLQGKTPSMKGDKNTTEFPIPSVIEELLKAGYLKPEENENGKYDIADNKTVKSCFEFIFENFVYENDNLVGIFEIYINHGVDLSTLKRYNTDCKNHNKEEKTLLKEKK